MSLPYFNLYPTDFDGKTAHLTFAEDGAYNRLLRLQWSSPGCKLPLDTVWIMRKMRAVTPDDRAMVEAVIAEFFIKRGGKVFNERLMKEWAKSSVAHKKRISAGSKGGTAKALKTNKAGPSNAKAMLYQPEPEPEPDIRIGLGKPNPVEHDNSQACVDHFNAVADRVGWSKIQKVTQPRKSALSQRLRDVGGVQGWCDAIDRAALSPLLTGQNGRGWRADFDWLCKPSNFTKLMEGNYDPRTPNPTHDARNLRPGDGRGTVDAFAAVAARYSGRTQ